MVFQIEVHVFNICKTKQTAYLSECHEAWFAAYRRSLVANHMANWQPRRNSITRHNKASGNNFIHPSTPTLFWWARVRVKVKVCNWRTWRIFDLVKPNILVPDLNPNTQPLDQKNCVKCQKKLKKIENILLEQDHPQPQRQFQIAFVPKKKDHPWLWARRNMGVGPPVK